MKKIIILVIFLLSYALSYAQQTDVQIKKIGFYSDVIAGNKVKQGSKNLLKSKIDQLILQNGIGDIGNNQFVLLGKIHFIDESSTSTIPPLFKVVYNIQLIVGDLLMKKNFGVYTINNCIGISKNRQRAIMSAIGRVRSNRNMVNWLTETKEKIIDYYKNNCYTIILEANSLSERKKYDEALSLLSKMPKISNQCFMMAQNTMTEIFKKKNLHDKISNNNITSIDSLNQKTTSSKKRDTTKLLKQTIDTIHNSINSDKKEENKGDYDWLIE